MSEKPSKIDIQRSLFDIQVLKKYPDYPLVIKNDKIANLKVFFVLTPDSHWFFELWAKIVKGIENWKFRKQLLKLNE